MIMRNRFCLLFAVLALVAGGGCVNVKPWQREHLADYTMRGDRDPVGMTQAEHIVFARGGHRRPRRGWRWLRL